MSDWHLNRAFGPDGLVHLLVLLETGEFPPPEVNRVIMRLFVPGYEQARRYAGHAIAAGIVEPNLPPDYYFQTQLKTIIDSIPKLDEQEDDE